MIVDAHNHALLSHARTKAGVFPSVAIDRLVSDLGSGGVAGVGLVSGGTISFPVRESESAWLGTVDGLHRFWKGLEASAHDLIVVQSAYDVDLLGKETPGVLLGIEGWDCCLDASDLDPVAALQELARLGVRSIQPLGRHDSKAFRTEGPPHSDLKLSEIGKTLIHVARSLGMIIDLAHLSGDEPAFHEILELADIAPIASHHSCRALTDLPGALSDAAIQAIADAGGVIGIHTGRHWLSPANENASMDEFLHHIAHVIEIAGTAHVAIGTDHVDVRAMPIDLPDDMYIEGFQGPATMEIFSHAIRRLKLTGEEMEQLLWGNVLRVWKNALSTTAAPEAL